MMNKKILSLLMIIFICNNSAHGIDVYLFKSHKYMGDNDQLQGAANSITEEFSNHGINTTIIETYESNIRVSKNSISLFSSVEGIDKWSNIIKYESTTFSVFLTHQWWNNLLQHLPEKPSLSLIAVPQYTIIPAISESIIKYDVSVIGTNGVCSSLESKDLIQAYHNSLIPKQNTYILVLLAGDTQDADGKWRIYPQKEAVKLARLITEQYLATGNTILITNGPRTGKIDPISNKETDAHKNSILDKVTQAFLTELKKKVPTQKIIFYNFQYGTPSMLPAAMGAVLENKGSIFYIPGESISTASQAILLLLSKSIILYKHSAMLELHEKYLEKQLNMGCASIIDYQDKEIKPTINPSKRCSVNQCDEIAQKIYKLYK